MLLTEKDICQLKCINEDKLCKEIQRTKEKRLNKIILEEFNDYTVQYSPVGNYTDNPWVIICGKTTSGDSHDLFINAIRQGYSLHEACFQSIFSNMRDNLFKYLNMIGLFNYLKDNVEYWQQGTYKTSWENIFRDLNCSANSGIQLTQAFNCAILNKDKKKRSAEPPNKIFRMVNKEIGCLFEHFHIGSNLKLIIFLDTPSNDGRFHQQDYWKAISKHLTGVKVISITHPSNQNQDVYNYLGKWDQMKNQNKRERAERLFAEAKNVMNKLIKSTFD